MDVIAGKEGHTALLAVSRSMLECAEAGDWESVYNLQEKVQRLAVALFTELSAVTDVAVATATINEVLKINIYVTELGAKARDVSLQGINKLQQSRRAVLEYSENTG